MFDSGRKEGREGGRKEENFFHDYVYLGDGGHLSVTTSYQGGRGPPWCQRAGTAFPGDSAWREGRDGDN